MRTALTCTLMFLREPLRSPVTLALMVCVPVLFVIAAADALSDFAGALGGSLAGDAAIGLGAGWAAAFLAGAIGFFQSTSSREADRRLVIAGIDPIRVAGSRIAASLAMAVVASTAAFLTLAIRVDLIHPLHVAGAIFSFAVLYLCIGVAIGAVVTAPLEGSLLVVFVFLLDVFSGPGMAAEAQPWAISRNSGEILLTASLGRTTSTQDWVQLVAVTGAAVVAAILVFAASSLGKR